MKVIFDKKTGQLLGAHMVGAEVTELIQGYVVAMNLETTEEELMHTVFPHPTLVGDDEGSGARRLRAGAEYVTPSRPRLPGAMTNKRSGRINPMAKFANILETVGNTPVVKINKLAPKGINLYVKIEAFNPLGSVKDRLALGVIEAAEKSGELKPGQTVIEATSGNTGIGLAMVCAAKGYPLVVTMAETFSVERRKLMRFLGAKVVLTPAAGRGMGMVEKAQELAKTHGWFLTRQFENEANPDMHSRTTAREIIDDFKGEKLDYWVTGFGTGGTLNGVSRVLRQGTPRHQDRGVRAGRRADADEPHRRQERNPDGSPAKAHPSFKPHPMQGWSPDFIPKITGEAVDMKVIEPHHHHRRTPTRLNGAASWRRRKASSSASPPAAPSRGALEVCKTAPPGSTILAMLPDTGERYLSTPLFGDIGADMNEEEVKISNSTPHHRMPPKAA